MDKLNFYRKVIRDLIREYAQYKPARGDVQIEVIFDETNDHYELMYAGWNGPYRIHGSVLHIDIRNEKIWIQYDGIEEGVAEELVKAGTRAIRSFWLSSRRKSANTPILPLHDSSYCSFLFTLPL